MLDTTAVKLDLPTLNVLGVEEFVQALYGIFEHAPWVAQAAAIARPYGDLLALHAALMRAVRAAPEALRDEFLNGHPELTAGALAADLTAASYAEQASNRLDSVIAADALDAMLREYRARFGIPFIIALRRRTPQSVVRELSERLQGDAATERATALVEVGHVSRLRLLDRFAGVALPLGSAVLSARLDEMPVPALRVVLLQEGRPVWRGEVTQETTATMLAGTEFRAGHYALAVEGWAEDVLPRGAALRFAVRDPDRRITVMVRATGRGVTLNVRADLPPARARPEAAEA